MRTLIILIFLGLGSLLPTSSAGAPHSVKQLAQATCTSAEVESRLVKQLSEELPKGISLSIENSHTDAPVPLDAKLVEIDPHPPLGVVNFQFRAPKPGRPIFGNAVVRGFARVAVTRMALKHGEMLDGSKVTYERRDLTPYLQRGYFLADVPLEGMRANGFVRPGTVLCASNTQTPNAVEHGQLIDLVNRKGSLIVTARVKALESGKVNDWIQVENPDTRRILSARVTRSGEAETR